MRWCMPVELSRDWLVNLLNQCDELGIRNQFEVEVLSYGHLPLAYSARLKSDIKKGDIVPFYGEIRAQDGTLKNKKDKAMKPEAIMEMDWLTDNVIGEIPTMGELRAEARPVVQIKGVEEKMK